MGDDVVSIDLVQRQLQEFMLVLPVSLTLSIVLPFIRPRWGIGNFGDEKCSRGLCNAVDEDTQ